MRNFLFVSATHGYNHFLSFSLCTDNHIIDSTIMQNERNGNENIFMKIMEIVIDI